MLTDSSNFYSQLLTTSTFSSLENINSFTPAPDDWWVVIADVKNSTDAVTQGRYKEVNMIGASCITAILNVIKDVDVPFVFGGDGATLLIPEHLKTDVITALISTQELSREEFELELRFGLVCVREIRQHDKDVLVARYQLSLDNSLAMFSGGGVELSDKLIKQDASAEKHAIADCSAQSPPDLTGLSCRWQPLASQHGKMVCLLVQTDKSGY